MIQALSSHTAQKAFADRIGSWCMIRCGEDLDAAGCGHVSETGSKLAIMITNEVLRLCWLLSISVPQKNAHDGTIGSFSMQSTHQIGGVKVSCITVYFLIVERIC
jgi:hypothetical protein